MSAPAPRLVTAEELAQLPDDALRYDLLYGRLVTMAPAGGRHGELAMDIGARVWNHVRRHHTGRVFGAETGFRLARDPDVVLGPDVAFVRADRLPPPDQRERFLELAPDLAVEIVSPTDRPADVRAKVQAYLRHGVQLLWVVAPGRQQVTVAELFASS